MCRSWVPSQPGDGCRGTSSPGHALPGHALPGHACSVQPLTLGPVVARRFQRHGCESLGSVLGVERSVTDRESSGGLARWAGGGVDWLASMQAARARASGARLDGRDRELQSCSRSPMSFSLCRWDCGSPFEPPVCRWDDQVTSPLREPIQPVRVDGHVPARQPRIEAPGIPEK